MPEKVEHFGQLSEILMYSLVRIEYLGLFHQNTIQTVKNVPMNSVYSSQIYLRNLISYS